ncbi:MAG: hypothetical protein ACRCYC_00990 [Paraclostridium sp.]|uniref:hypothetical protein n=1 Tax=Paraclostridium sp. TaxID=2023273 RepID=UPI003AA0A5C0
MQKFIYDKDYLEFIKLNFDRIDIKEFRKVIDEEIPQIELDEVMKRIPQNSEIHIWLKRKFDSRYFDGNQEERGVTYPYLIKAIAGFKQLWKTEK